MYRSPIAISGLSPADFSNDAAPRATLLLARRKLEAELELSGSDTVEVAGTHLNRQDIITLFDELSDAKKLPYHLAIAADPPLQQFLETGRIDPGARWQQHVLYDDAGFLFFVSQYYAEATDALYRSVLKREQSIDALQALAANPSLMLGGDSDRAFRAVTRYFLDRTTALQQLLAESRAGRNYPKEEVSAAIPEEDIYVLNSLPDGFEELRYEIASTLNNICVAFDKRSRPKPALAAIERAAMVHIEGGELRTLIPNNLKLVRNKQPGFRFFTYGNEGKKSPKIGAIIAVFIIIIRIFSGANGCNQQSYQPPSGFTVPEDHRAHDYHANLASFLETISSKSSEASFPTNDTLRLTKPVDGVPPFEELYSLINSKEDTSVMPITSDIDAPKNQVRLVNQSPWDVIIFYTRDHQTANSLYVPPGKTRTLNYATQGLWLDFTAGSHWDATDSRLIFEAREHFSSTAHRISGWYSQQPANLSDFVQSGQSLIGAAYDSTSKSALVLTFTRTPGQFANSITLNVDTALIKQTASRFSPAPSR